MARVVDIINVERKVPLILHDRNMAADDPATKQRGRAKE